MGRRLGGDRGGRPALAVGVTVTDDDDGPLWLCQVPLRRLWVGRSEWLEV